MLSLVKTRYVINETVSNVIITDTTPLNQNKYVYNELLHKQISM